MDAPTYVIVDGWMDRWMDKGKSKCPLKWGHKNNVCKYTVFSAKHL